MRRSRIRSVALVAVLALVVAGGSSATAVAATGTGEVAQASAKQGAKGKAKGKQKARACTKAKRGKGRGKARRSSAEAQASAKKGAKGKRRAKRCATRRAAPKKRGDDGRRPSSDPRERRREREEAKGRRRPTAPKPAAPVRVAPADGSYTAAAAPGLTFTISDGGTRGRIAYTVPKSDFDGTVCQTDDVVVAVPIELSRSNDGGSGMIGSQQLPGGGSASILGSVSGAGAFTVTISTNRPYAPDPTATCSASSRLTGTLVR